MAAKLMEDPDILLCAELIGEFLEFYKMNFTLQILVLECNLPTNNKIWDKLQQKLGLEKRDPPLPGLMQILRAYKQGNRPQKYKESESVTLTLS